MFPIIYCSRPLRAKIDSLLAVTTTTTQIQFSQIDTGRPGFRRTEFSGIIISSPVRWAERRLSSVLGLEIPPLQSGQARTFTAICFLQHSKGKTSSLEWAGLNMTTLIHAAHSSQSI